MRFPSLTPLEAVGVFKTHFAMDLGSFTAWPGLSFATDDCTVAVHPPSSYDARDVPAIVTRAATSAVNRQAGSRNQWSSMSDLGPRRYRIVNGSVAPVTVESHSESTG